MCVLTIHPREPTSLLTHCPVSDSDTIYKTPSYNYNYDTLSGADTLSDFDSDSDSNTLSGVMADTLSGV